MGSSLQALQDQYFFLTQNLSDMLAACETQAQRDALQAQYVTARRNFFNCINKTLHDDDPAAAALVQQMKTEQENLKKAVTDLSKIATVISVITDAVKVGTALASLAG
ncbi:hypothetical protein [Paracidobacterium acidisoli]|uniref:Uncharacterized protein n=1 Tax=Paracidobacterium acidisoli TaxID=2303751 RepID=A0A372IRN2_9BACT|nr:hypothetical protein [Paracidobacterium acidisoli]MBT9331564.1 hypothetical protein [Paracidobacterium acidisoli]